MNTQILSPKEYEDFISRSRKGKRIEVYYPAYGKYLNLQENYLKQENLLTPELQEQINKYRKEENKELERYLNRAMEYFHENI